MAERQPISDEGADQTIPVSAATPPPSPSVNADLPPPVSSAAFSSGSASSSSFDHGRFLPGTVLATRYRIVALLGRGGMGEVYRADDLKLGQTVALKFLPASLAADAIKLSRFHSEVRLSRQIAHPNICSVYDIGEAEGADGVRHTFLSMEYIDGEDLAGLLRRIGRFPQDKGLEVARQLCAALAAAHDKGVLHRDLKPPNILIDERGKLLITDFGLAGLIDQIPDADRRAGTPAYMAPEQLTGGEPSARSDLYSLGLVLYEVFTGKSVFRGGSVADVMERRAQGTAIVPPSELVHGLDPGVEEVILKCLDPDPAQRPASARAVLAALPGGDPLAAALAAGQTPSPELVAASGGTGALPKRTGLMLAGGFALILIILAAINATPRRKLTLAPVQQAPLILQNDAARLIRGLGYTEPPADTAFGVIWDDEYLQHAGRGGASGAVDLSQGGYFWYRQGPEPLLAADRYGRVSPSDPAPRHGMATVMLKADGELALFLAVGPANLPPPAPSGSPISEADWSKLFDAAGLDPTALVAEPAPTHNPPVHADVLRSWALRSPPTGAAPLRVEAASLRGHAVYFAVIRGGHAPPYLAAPTGNPLTASFALAGVVFIILWAVRAATLVLTWRNLRLGRGDRRGATRVAAAVALATLVWLLLLARFRGVGEEANVVLSLVVAMALFNFGLIWTYYVAIEPYVRRAWPQRLVSWARVLAGRFADPLVGRDALIGLSIGAAAVLLTSCLGLIIPRLGHGLAMRPTAEAYLSMRHTLGMIGLQLLFSVHNTLWLLCILVILLTFSRRKRHVSAAFVVILAPLVYAVIATGTWWVDLLATAIWTTAIAVSLLRFGLLTAVATAASISTLNHFPPVADLSLWFASQAWFGVSAIAGLGLYAFYLATRGQTSRGDGFLDALGT